MVMDNKFEIQLLSWSPEYSEDIMEVYRLLKDQEKKIFDLSFYDGLGDEPIMAYVEDKVTNDLVFVVKPFRGTEATVLTLLTLTVAPLCCRKPSARILVSSLTDVWKWTFPTFPISSIPWAVLKSSFGRTRLR